MGWIAVALLFVVSIQAAWISALLGKLEHARNKLADTERSLRWWQDRANKYLDKLGSIAGIISKESN